jgi:anti-anti-sigma regulatory factor
MRDVSYAELRRTARKVRVMSIPEFKHVVLRNVDGIVVIEMVTRDIQGPDLARDFIAELMAVVELDDRKPIVLNLRRAFHFSSMGYAALFKLVKSAKERNRPVRFCNMHEDVRVGGDIIGLPLVVKIHDSEESAVKDFEKV